MKKLLPILFTLAMVQASAQYGPPISSKETVYPINIIKFSDSSGKVIAFYGLSGQKNHWLIIDTMKTLDILFDKLLSEQMKRSETIMENIILKNKLDEQRGQGGWYPHHGTVIDTGFHDPILDIVPRDTVRGDRKNPGIDKWGVDTCITGGFINIDTAAMPTIVVPRGIIRIERGDTIPQFRRMGIETIGPRGKPMKKTKTSTYDSKNSKSYQFQRIDVIPDFDLTYNRGSNPKAH